MSDIDKAVAIFFLLLALLTPPFAGVIVGMLLEEPGREFWHTVRELSYLLWAYLFGSTALLALAAWLAVTIAGVI